MYVVKINGIVAHDPSLYDETKILASGTVSKKVNSADTFNFTIYPDNVCYNQIDSNSEVWVEVLKNGNSIFYGRVLKEETGWDNEKKITCEGLLALFNDSVLRPYEYQGSVLGYINYLVNQHNAQMNGTKQFIVRNVTVTDPNDNIVRSNSDYTKTITELIDKTAGSSLGGYLIVEYLNGAYYLDYLADSVQGTNQTLAFGENILDFQRSIDSESMATAIIPLGAKSDETGEYLTISSVNDGRDYIENSEAVSNRGLIFTTYRWEDVTVPANLLRKATALLSDLTRIVPKINLSAVDLTEAGYNIDEIGFFEYVTVSDTAHDVNGQYLITERTYDLLSPENDKVTFGSDDKTISGQSSRNQNSVAAVSSTVLNQARAIIEYQTELLKGGEGGYFVVGTDTDGHPSEIYFLDTNDKDTARSVLRINKNGIGFSTTGFDGPYTNAWTIDGNLNASYITTGIFKDAATNGQKFSFNLETGEMHLDALDILVGGLYVGGRNLIINSLNAVISPAADRIRIIGQSGNTVVGGSAGAAEHGIRSISTTPIRPYIRFGAASGSMNGLVAGQTYTFSADVSWVLLSNYTGTTKYQIRAAIYGNASGSMATQAYADIESDCTTNKTGTAKCRFTFTVDSNTTEVYLYVYCNDTTASHYATTDYLEIANVKLETGEIATAWSPAYEDLNGYADHTAAAQISAHDDEIYLAVSETYTSKEDAAVINMMPSIYSREYTDGKEYVSPTGITWTVNDDGSVTAKGTASSITWYSLTRSDGVTTGAVPPIKIDPDKKYTLSGGPAGSSGSTYKMFYRLYTDDTTHGSWISFNNKVTFGPNSKYVEIGIQIYANYTCPEEGVTFYPMLEPGTVAHGYISPRNGTGAIGNLARTNKASIDLQAQKIAIVVEEKNGVNVIKSASIVTAINGDSSVTINADRVNLQGAVSISSLDSAAKEALLTGATSKNQYYLSTSASSATGGTWYDSPNSITWQSGGYVWTRVATTKTYANNTSTTTYSTAVYDKQLTTALSTASSAQSTADSAAANTPIVNLFPSVYYTEAHSGNSVTNNGITWITNLDGSVTATGTATGQSNYYLTTGKLGFTYSTPARIKVDPNKKYTFSHGAEGGDYSTSYSMQVTFYDSSLTQIANRAISASGSTLQFANQYEIMPFLRVQSGYACPSGGITFYPQMEVGDTAHAYVSTHGGSAAITANSVKSTVSCYYRTTSSSFSTKPTAAVTGTAQDTDNTWTLVMPRPKKGTGSTNYYYYTCEQYTMADGTVSWSTVRAIPNANYTAMWCSSADQTCIDGGAIYANSVTADKINVTDLQAFGATIGGFTIDATSIRSAALTSTADAAIGLSTADFSRSIGGTSRSALRLAIGSGFGVSKTGVLYASNAVISGQITSSNATITGGSIKITTGDGGFSVGQDLGIRYFHPNNSLAYQMQTDQTTYFDDDGTIRYSFSTSTGFEFRDANETIISQFPANRGDRVINNNSSAVSLASATSGMTNLTNISLNKAGLYLLLCTVRFTTNATGYRYACLSTTSTSAAPVSWSAQVVTQATTGNGTYVSFPAYVNVSSSATYYLNARQNSGSTISTTGFINAIKIA